MHINIKDFIEYIRDKNYNVSCEFYFYIDDAMYNNTYDSQLDGTYLYMFDIRTIRYKYQIMDRDYLEIILHSKKCNDMKILDKIVSICLFKINKMLIGLSYCDDYFNDFYKKFIYTRYGDSGV